jgi:hypothetical protein
MDMAESNETAQLDQRLVRYLLGQLPEADTERLEEASIVDDEVAARLRIVEDDLVDAYVTGTLDRTTRERFESYYLASPRRCQKVATARRLLDAVDRAPATQTVAQTVARRTRWRAGMGWSLIAAAVVILAVGFVFEDARLRQQVHNAQRGEATLANQVRSLTTQLDEQRGAGAQARNELDRLRAAPPASMTALVLLPQTRAVGPVPTIAVPPDADAVMFDLRLEAQDFGRYRVALKDPATGQTVWRSDPLTAGASPRPPTITVAVPASVLRPQHYSFDLVGLSSGASDTIAAYTFQVEMR